MPWAVDFLPPHIMEFTNLVTSVDPYTGSGATSRFAMCPFLGINPQNSRAFALFAISAATALLQNPEERSLFLRCAALGALCAVFRPALRAGSHAHRIQSSPDHVITHSGKILNAAPADEHNRVLLQVVADAGNVSGHFNPVGEPHAGYFTQRRVRLLGRLRIHARTHATPLRRTLQCGRRRFVTGGRTPLANKLIKSWQTTAPYFKNP